ncbi:GntR family transcriptional regulator [Georgenia yuyongxinii]|uniref:GntR family transcriptional regulator n=1 Tax=Georgenia yuyongxinii TaxID=2589797 RepID=A0A552WM24_9MICO|nr:GntR family transcriptional regulator [Georgenia yuyongxinii]TRW43825.1 GntR family transcriptional regulator [Georgenia yuyongxinii]
MLLRIDPTSSALLFEQLAAQVRAAVVAGTVRSGERLPAARDLAESLDINQHTVLRAYQQLRDEGLLELRRGRGAVVTAHAAEQYERLGQALEVVRREAHALGLPLSAVAAMIATEEK